MFFYNTAYTVERIGILNRHCCILIVVKLKLNGAMSAITHANRSTLVFSNEIPKIFLISNDKMYLIVYRPLRILGILKGFNGFPRIEIVSRNLSFFDR